MKFNYKYLDYAFIDDKEQLSTYFDQLFNEEAEEEISILLSKYPALMNSGVAKIFDFLTTEDSVSISRHGHRVTIPPFWAAFNLEIPEAYKAREIIAFLDDFQPLVEYAHESFKVVPQNTPNDQFYFRQEGLADPAGLADINVEQAWAIETGKKFVKVGVHDNGIDSLNPDIDVLTGRDYFANQGATNWGTESFGILHGTHVAGIAALLLSHYNRPCYSNQNLTIEDVEYLLEESATDIFTPGFDQKSGAGRLNAGAALNMIGEPTRQMVHPDSLIASDIVRRDTIALAYNKAFVQDGWGPISQNLPLEQEREYKVERVYVENTYSFAHFTTPNTTILDSWACPSISNSVEFYRDTIETVILSQGGIPNDGYIFQLFDRDPFDTIVNIDTLNKEIVVGGYFYKFLLPYLDNLNLVINQGSNTGRTFGSVIEDNVAANAINAWYPFNPESKTPRMVTSLYISDPSFTEQYRFPCDSINLLVDDTTITDPVGTAEFEINETEIKLFPNPGKESFTILFSNHQAVKNVTVYSSEGKKVKQIPTNQQSVNVTINNWRKGVYYIQISGDSFSTTRKYIKQ